MPEIERQVEARDHRHIDAGHGENLTGIVDRLGATPAWQ